MRKITLLFAAALICGAAAYVFGKPNQNPKNSHYVPLAAGLERFQNYRQWSKVNPQPLSLKPLIATLCVAPNPLPPELSPASPHLRLYFTVYVNKIGQQAMFKKANPVFPVGSIVIKEKLAAVNSKTPELFTAMVKHPTGYDKANGDWEYVVLNGTATKMTGQGKLDSCQSCHVASKATDYVFRTYLPADIMNALQK